MQFAAEIDCSDDASTSIKLGLAVKWAVKSRANLNGANLDGANLAGAKLVGNRPVFQVGPIGSRCSYFVAYLTDQGIKVRAGCFFGTVDQFREKLSKEHGANDHAKEYNAAMELIRVHAELWAPAEVAQEAA